MMFLTNGKRIVPMGSFYRVDGEFGSGNKSFGQYVFLNSGERHGIIEMITYIFWSFAFEDTMTCIAVERFYDYWLSDAN
jgi:hypothetical protein